MKHNTLAPGCTKSTKKKTNYFTSQFQYCMLGARSKRGVVACIVKM